MPKKGYKYGNPFKFKSIKIYSSPEWMANSKKKYRTVFDKEELTYVRVQFSFYNKLFDEEDWEAKVAVKILETNTSDRKEICTLENTHYITKDKNVVDAYESWGVDTPGSFWKKGSYICEAYIDGIFVGSQVFFIEDVGLVKVGQNPYFDLVSVKLYSGDSEAWNISTDNRVYLTQFHKTDTKYVWVELTIRNKTNKAWNFEYFIHFFDDAGQHKAQIDTIRYIANGEKDKTFIFDRGWGSNDPGSWKDISYSVEIVFMDTLIASGKFTTGDTDIEGLIEIASSRVSAIQQQVAEVGTDSESLEDVTRKLNELIGLENIKQKIKDHISYLDFIKIRKSKGFDDNEDFSLHSVFTGNPGTGKTTVVKLLGQIYKKMGLLSKGHVHEVDRADLVGEYIGQTAPKVKEAIEEARGGILFIDEAYMLVRAQDDKKDFGKEVIEVLVKEMSDGKGDIAIMAAGYPKEMEYFVDSNPGLKSRFKYFFHFDDYLPDELMAIAEYATTKRSVHLSPEASALIRKTLTEAYRNRDKTFGNARYTFALIDEGKMNMGLRLMKSENVKNLSNEDLSTITLEDVEKINPSKSKRIAQIPIDENLLKETVSELNSLVGLNNIKNDVNELIKLVRYYRETGKDVLNQFSLHTVFTGNPGTGKTTVARIMGKVYKALGLLEKGHMVESGRDGLVAGYIGQTALKTKEKVDAAMGGVLFIDEAYALSEGGQNSYGKEAIEVILKNMEDQRGQFAVIVAGYPDNMDNFLRSNPGLKSRFDRTMHFNDYDEDSLTNIALSMLAEQKLTPDESAFQHLKTYLGALYKKRDKFFGNARSVRKVIETAVRNQNLRMASKESGKRTADEIKMLILDDVVNIKIDEGIKVSGGIGF
jgi:SpoVK/Ycf46/Vps4 family AAA+-type ATPase